MAIKGGDKGVYVGGGDIDDESDIENDGLDDIWKEMAMAIECSKVSCLLFIINCNLVSFIIYLFFIIFKINEFCFIMLMSFYKLDHFKAPYC